MRTATRCPRQPAGTTAAGRSAGVAGQSDGVTKGLLAKLGALLLGLKKLLIPLVRVIGAAFKPLLKLFRRKRANQAEA